MKKDKPATSSIETGARTQDIQYYNDWSNTVHTIVVREQLGNYQSNSWYADIPSDYVLIGGGAYTVNTETNGGGYVTASYPDFNNNRWRASSKDHHVVDQHTLYVYAIGLKLDGVSNGSIKK